METVEPITFDKKIEFIWFGVEQARSQQQIQMQIAMLNVFRGIPPEQYAPYTLNLRPLMTHMAGSAFGPQLAPLTFEGPEEQMPVSVDQENEMLGNGFEIKTHELDDDNAHIQSHMQLLQQDPQSDYAKKIQAHIFTHIQQMNRKAMMVGMAGGPMAGGMPSGQPQGAPGVPGGAGPGVAGSPKPGAVPAPPKGAQQPPGAIHQDQLHDPSQMPRKLA
jgi:hypothetical protein